MDLMGQLGELLGQYSGANANEAPAEVEQHFDEVAQNVPAGALADGLAAAFRDTTATPAFGNMAAQLFGNSGGSQKADVMNMLMAAAGPIIMQKMMGGNSGGGGIESALGGLLGGGGSSALGGLLGGGGGGGGIGGMLGGLLGGGGSSALAGLLGGGGGGGQISADMADKIPTDVVEQMAQHAAEHDPSVMDKLSAIYAEHPTLIKTLGGAALTIALSKIANSQKNR